MIAQTLNFVGTVSCCGIWRSLSMTPLLAALVTITAGLTSAGAIGRPQPDFVKKESATSASSRSAAQAAGAGRSDRSPRPSRARGCSGSS
jgi:hypothetical protein